MLLYTHIEEKSGWNSPKHKPRKAINAPNESYRSLWSLLKGKSIAKQQQSFQVMQGHYLDKNLGSSTRE